MAVKGPWDLDGLRGGLGGGGGLGGFGLGRSVGGESIPFVSLIIGLNL